MVGRRFLALTLAGLMVATSVNTGSIRAYAYESGQVAVLSSDNEESTNEAFNEAEEVKENLESDSSEVTAQGEEAWDGAGDSESDDPVFYADELYEDQTEASSDSITGNEEAIENFEDDAVTGELQEEPEYTVTLTLNANGGLFENDEETLILTVNANSALEMDIDAPVKDGFSFTGWFLDEELTEAVDPSAYIFTENSVLFAGWQEVSDESIDEEMELMAADYFVLDANGGTFLSGKARVKKYEADYDYIDSDTYRVTNGTKAFTGWYKDIDCTLPISSEDNLWHFKEYPVFGETYYAGWEEDSYKLTYIIGDDSDEYGKNGYYYDAYSSYEPQKIKVLEYYIPAGACIGNYDTYAPDSRRVRNSDLHVTFNGWYLGSRAEGNIIDDITSYKPVAPTVFYAEFIDDSSVITIHAGEDSAYFSNENSNNETYGRFTTYKDVVFRTNRHYLYLRWLSLENDNPQSVIEGAYSDASCSEESRLFKGESGNIDASYDRDIYIKWEHDDKVKTITFDLNGDYGEFYDDGTDATTGKVKGFRLDDDSFSFDVKLKDLHYKLLGFSADETAKKPDSEWTIDYEEYENENIEPVKSVYFYNAAGRDDSITLYGVWEKREGFVITFDSTSSGYFYKDYYTGKYVTKEYYITNKSGWLRSYPIPESVDSAKDFKAWLMNGKETNVHNTHFTSEVTLSATYDTAYTVTLDANGGKIFDSDLDEYVDSIIKKVAKGNEIRLDYELSYDGKEFAGWYAEKDCITPVSKYYFIPTRNCTVYAKWTDSYSVVFNYGNGVVTEPDDYNLSVLKGDTVVSAANGNSIPKDPEAAGNNMTFAGWYTDENLTKPIEKPDIENYVVTENTTFYAKYDESFTATFVADHGFASASENQVSINVAKNETLKGRYPTAKSADDAVFKGWYKDNKLVDNIYNYKVTGDVTFTAGYDQGFYTLTFHANREGASLDGGLKEIKVKVAKGTAFRYSKNNTYSDELFSAPSLNASGVTDNVVPLERINSNGSKTVGWATNEAGTGSIYMFSSYSHTVIEQDGTSRGLGMYGFVPTSDMDFYAKWDEPVRLIFTSNKLKLREGSQYDIYGELSSDRTQRALKVPKGITFASVSTPSPNIFDTSEYAFFSYRWSLDKDGKNSITNDTKVTEGIKVYLYVYNESQTSPTAERMIFYSGDGYFDSPTKKEYTFNYDKTVRTLSPTIPSINDSTKAFDGWYLDAECKNRYDDKYQFYSGGTWRVVPTKGVTELYAGFSSTYTVTLDANGGYFDDSSSRTKDPDEALRDRTRFVVKASPAKQGIRISDYTQRIRRDGNKIFTGWYYEDGKRAALTSDGINQEFFKSDKGNCTLYAGWEDYVPVTSVSVAKREQTISIGESVLLKATIQPDSAENEDIHWNISSYQCADDNTYYKVPVSITSEGLVTGMATGTAGVYAIVNGVMSELVIITVSEKPVQNKISIPEEFKNLNLINGDKIVVKADVTPLSKEGDVKWKSANDAIASVEGDGALATITAGDTEGTTTITATLGTLKATLSVTVSVPIKLDKNELTLTAGGDSNTLEAIVSNPELSQKQVIWTITDDSVASVKADSSDSKKAVVVPADTLDESATAVIKATLDGTEYSAECIVTVNAMLKAEKPEADVPAETVKKGTVVKIKSATAGAVVFYTTDGSEPQVDAGGTPSGTTSKLQDALTIDEDMTIKAVAFKSGFVVSETAVFEYKVDNQNWGQIGELLDEDPLKELIEKHFENDSSKVPAGVWFIFRNGDEYKIVTEAGGDTGISRPYCGDKITFNDDIIILNGTGFLIENRDYTLTYANNTLANVAQKKVPQVTIKGKGIYNSSVVFTFTISPESISEADITSEHVVTVLAGKSTKLGNTKPALSYNGKKLTLGKDYELFYYKGDAPDPNNLVADPAKEIISTSEYPYYIEIAGKAGSNFTGTHTEHIDVIPVPNEKNRVQVSKLKVTDAKGKAIKIAVDYPGIAKGKFVARFDNREGDDKASYFVTYGKDKLTYGKDYTITVPGEDVSDAGKYVFVIAGVGKENLAEGENEYIGEKTCTYEVKGLALSKVKIAGLKTSVEYTGSSIGMENLFSNDKVCQAQGWDSVTLYTIDSKTKAVTPLVEHTDYEVEDHISGVVGKYNLVFTGLGQYTGSVKKVITVKAASFKTVQNKLEIIVDEAAYVKTGARPNVTVKFAGSPLTEGADYSVTYKNNTKVADKTAKSAPYVTVKGIGNYTGTSAKEPFTINKGKISQVKLTVNDVTYKQGKTGYYFATPKLMDNGKAITTGKNKDVEAIKKTDYVYTYETDTWLENGDFRAGGVKVEKTDKIPVGTTIVVTVPVSCSEKSPYTADVTSLSGSFRIIGQGKDISKAKVTVRDKSKLVVNNGEEVKLTNADLEVTLGKNNILKPGDYDIVSISNNRGVGKAVLVIEGRGEYGGSKSVTLNITARSMK